MISNCATPRLTSLSLALLLAVLSPRLATAQVQDTARADTTRPFVRGGVYDKPYQTRLLGRTALGGYVEAHARHERVDGARDEAGFAVKRFNVFLSTRVSDIVRMAAEVEFEDGTKEILLEYAAIDVRIHPAFALRGGMLLSPLGRFNLSHDSPLNEFTDRPLVSTEILGVALSEPGFGALGQVPLGARGRLTYETYLTNGFHEGLIRDAEDGTRIPLGRRNVEDENGSPAVVGRVAWSPRVGVEVGVSAHHGAWNVFESEGVRLDRRRDLTIGVVDAEVGVAGFRLSGEAATARVEIPQGLEGIYAGSQRGFFADLTRDFGRGWVATLPEAFFTAKLRFDRIDLDTGVIGDDVTQVSVGVNFRPTSDSVIKLDLVRGRSHDRFNNASDHARLLASFATYF
ncbi:MAG TPA: hypothetical protein VLE53_06445 [Gemmatimonadaceae bacterium]|nr:hypothetical protein [Gemmatimonadaceae bacterium]